VEKLNNYREVEDTYFKIALFGVGVLLNGKGRLSMNEALGSTPSNKIILMKLYLPFIK
jgi:hypothetical protein